MLLGYLPVSSLRLRLANEISNQLLEFIWPAGVINTSVSYCASSGKLTSLHELRGTKVSFIAVRRTEYTYPNVRHQAPPIPFSGNIPSRAECCSYWCTYARTRWCQSPRRMNKWACSLALCTLHKQCLTLPSSIPRFIWKVPNLSYCIP